ncbi:MAG: DUF2071 domain-containing protein [Acidobacteria bacterium]|nr:MAG: DUF2071 domain-containing protein [Acidobacteriota bacterium]REJ99332.1 MAG: DUF2071 domain-containing protein [Acidobacteriota bacterium]REK15646.1 MAG: DUF2071 domain-containing protein [Acidobacteriota bacterium]REK43629.1 MAG: DUF2071 domain-containing protein [Acidobacteriota bacterium]
MRKFLTAEWRDLVMANYEVEPRLLEDLTPNGTELDLNEGKCFVSLVAFKFVNTKVLGFPVPFHTDFLEVNLRFYVLRKTPDEDRRGVVFVKEIVPRSAITFVARTLYGEPYETWKMALTEDSGLLSYSWSDQSVKNRLSVRVGENQGVPENGSHGEFIIEHYWGYTARGSSRTDEYKVEHPKWELFELDSSEIAVDFGATYGDRFNFLNEASPYSVIMAKGSEIAVYKGERISG